MQAKGFSIGEMIKFGWRVMKDNFPFFIGIVLTMEVINNIPYVIGYYFPDNNFLQAILFVLGVVLSLWMTLGIVKIALAFSRNEQGKFTDLFSCFPLIGKYFVASVLYFLILLAGLLLLVFPFFIWGAKYGLFPYFIVEKGAGPIESLKMSAETSYGAKWDIFGLWVAVGIINLAGMLCLGVGLLATLPTTWVALASAYRRLLSQTNQTQLTIPDKTSPTHLN